VYLAAHPDGVHANGLAGAVWRRGVANEVRDAGLSRVHAWLGTDEAGRPNLVTDEGGRFRLGPGARVDWQVFRALFAQASRAAAASDPAAEAGCLERALTLVRGQFLDGRDPARDAWLATDEIEYEVTAAAACAAVVPVAACSSPSAPAFNPGGPASTAPATPMATSSGPGSVIMPPFGKNAHVVMTDWMPKDADMAKAVLANKDYELAFLYAEYTGGKSQDWTAFVSHTMELQVRALLAKPDVTTESFKGTIKIFDMKVIRDPTV